jgi:hypothetical protein
MVKKAVGLLVVGGLALAGVPAVAQGFGPNTVWGIVPQGEKDVVRAVLLDDSGRALARVAVTDGRFVFRDLAPGGYTVGLHAASGRQVARTCPLQLLRGSEMEALFDCGPAPATPRRPGAATPTGAATRTGTASARGGVGAIAPTLAASAATGLTEAALTRGGVDATAPTLTAPAAPAATAATTASTNSTTKIAEGATYVGITVGIVIAGDQDQGPASPIR